MRSFPAWLLLTLIPVHLTGQDTLYFGVNDRPLPGEQGALHRMILRERNPESFVLHVFSRPGEKWVRSARKRIRVSENLRQEIRIWESGKLLPGRIVREMKPAGGATYRFRESGRNGLLREGTSTRFLPLHLEGEMTEYYPDGKIKSIAQYSNNQLVSNENWLPDGTPYISDIFYSADREPTYRQGGAFFNAYVVQQLRKSRYDLSQIQDRVVIGWVIMEDGAMDGVVALEGKSPKFNRYLVEIIETLPGQWNPARLDGTNIRYFMSIPVSFSTQEVNFQDLELSDSGWLHYDRY